MKGKKKNGGQGGGLRYVGEGTAWVVAGVILPTRDLTGEEVEWFGGVEALVASGLYVEHESEVTEDGAIE